MRFKVAFFRHDLGQEEIDAVAAALRHPVLTTGETVERFERRLADYLGCRHALAVTSCTGAMHLSLLALGIGPGDEVITTPMTFIATTTAILEAGAKPVFIDVEPETGNMDVARIEAAITPRTKAILPVHLYGRMCDMVAMRAVAERHGLAIVEDAAHCLEGQDRGIRPGGASQTACFSFYATKNITCGEGGALATNDTALYQKLKLLRLHGMDRTGAERTVKGYQHWDMVLMGWKYNMSNIDAAILLPQMERVERNLQRRRQLTDRYRALLQPVAGVTVLPPVAPESVHAHHLFPILVQGMERDQLVQALQSQGISVMVNYRPVHLTRYFAETFGFAAGDFPIAERIGDTVLSLPLYPTMPDADVEIVAQSIAALLAG
ncbi:MAG: DegT/DnrJ/EryC1/StrS family aminotransferase [Magnetococcales bacterium]|nr:DegT/DnrJ/EryC1/StrS family aminotransferase [Magnetococcales bacterium]MBF0113924.1 DegT/DnrJ/EryC1/StrS family aminotransferase [Magnetococcales bacterium]